MENLKRILDRTKECIIENTDTTSVFSWTVKIARNDFLLIFVLGQDVTAEQITCKSRGFLL